MYFGADYYPEEWPRERWSYDAQLMAEAGFDVVRLAELAWSLIEPEPDRYDFGWLDDIIALLHRHGIATVLGTPTTVAPPWLVDLDPEIMAVWEDGSRSTYGYWSNYCITGPVWRERSRRLVEAMARHYAANPAVIGWQIDNEFGVMGRARCYCGRCQEAYRQWLKRRHGTLDHLREAWGTTFWSHTYSDWSQIPIPRKTTGHHNPGLVLDFARFCSDKVAAYQELQAEILRREAPKQFLTHNFLGAQYTHLDNFQLGQALDLVAWDNYIAFEHPAGAALSHDVLRSVKRRSFWVLEEQCSHKYWAPHSQLPRGAARLMSYQGIAHGADAIVYFRWRAGLIGAEQFHDGVLPHDGRPGRVYEEIKGLGQELIHLRDALDGTLPRAEVAFVLSYESLWALENQPHHADLANPLAYFQTAYDELRARHIPVDFVPPTGDLSAYRLVIAPALFVLRPEAVESLTRFVEGGGTLLVTVRSGEKDEHNRVVDIPFPGLLVPLLGVTVREFDSRPAGERTALEIEGEWGPATLAADTWHEWLEPAEAVVVARYAEGLYTGQAAATWRALGRGGAMYLGTLGAAVTGHLLGRLLAAAGVQPPVAVEAPPPVEVAVREGSGRKVIFLLNFSPDGQTARLGTPAQDLLAGERVAGAVEIAPYGVRVLQV